MLNASPTSPRLLVPGLVSVTFRQLGVAEIVRLAGEGGLRAIEWGGDVHVPPGRLAIARDVAERTREAGLSVAAYGSYYLAGAGVEPGFETVLETAIALEAPMVRVWAGRQGSREIDAAARSAVVRDLARIAHRAATVGVKIVTEFHLGTLTDTDASAQSLLHEIAHPNLHSYWQPRHGEPTEVAAAGLRALLPHVRGVHVFHWWPTAQERRPLAEGAERWRTFLAALQASGRPCNVLLEFVRDDEPGAFLRDAATLRELVAAVGA